MHGRAHRKIVCPTQKQSRDTHGERKGMGILFKEARGTSDTRQTHTHTHPLSKEERGTSDTRQAGRQTHTHTRTHTRARPEPGGAQHGGGVNLPNRTVLSLFVYLWPITLFPSSHLTGP